MKSSILAQLLLATGSFAAMGTERRRSRAVDKLAARRASIPRKSNPRFPAIDLDGSLQGNETQASYSSNWAGAVLIGSGYNSVTGTVVVPTPSGPNDGNTYYASAWVGIDGDTCQRAILQTGIDVGYQDGEYIFDAWYEWLPDYAHTFTTFSLSAGDSIQMTVSATSPSAGKATLKNLSTGQTVSKSFSGETSTLCETNAEWIVEDFEEGGGLVPFADFGKFTFTGASAGKTSGGSVGVTGATIFDIKQNNKVLTNCGTSGSSTVTCSYTG